MNKPNKTLEELDKKQLLNLAMVLEDIKTGLDTKLTNDYVVDINPFAVNNYFFANEDNFYFDDFEGHENYSNYTLRDNRSEILSYLKDEGVVKSIKLHKKPEEDPVGMGIYTDEIYNFEVAINKPKYSNYYKKVIDAVQPYLDAYIKKRDGDDSTVPELQISATLGFIRAGTPTVTVNERVYKLSTMRNGRAVNIVEYCLEQYPHKEVTLDTLKAKLALSGVTNLKDALHNSHFDVNTGLLRFFVVVEPKVICVKKSALINDDQLKAIIEASKNSE